MGYTYMDILKEEGAQEKLRSKTPIRKFSVYYRFCKRCGEIYKTKSQKGKICTFCDTSSKPRELIE